MRGIFKLGILSLCFSASCTTTFAEENAAQSQIQNPVQTQSQSQAPLQGQVVQIDVTLNDLRDARLAISRLRKAAANLYDEVTRQQVTMGFNPNVIGTTVIMMPRPSFTGAYLPARPKWVKESMDDIGPILELFKEDVDAAIESNRRTQVSEDARQSLDPLRDDVFARVKTSFATYQQLQQLTAGNTYDNNAIAAASKSLDNQMKELDRQLKRGISILQKEAKAVKKNA
ncbi:MAG TPA: hypothetical protein PKZ32_05085 [Candidatus Melainabacteria bacterium]|nr:hypothetical protein [Candidatus Melainabacteria bacterium]